MALFVLVLQGFFLYFHQKTKKKKHKKKMKKKSKKEKSLSVPICCKSSFHTLNLSQGLMSLRALHIDFMEGALEIEKKNNFFRVENLKKWQRIFVFFIVHHVVW